MSRASCSSEQRRARQLGNRRAHSAAIVRRCVGVLLTVLAVAAGRAHAGVSMRDRAACLPEVRRLCPEAERDLRSAIECLLRNRGRLGSPCRTVLAGYGL